jgi:hypothetical protein
MAYVCNLSPSHRPPQPSLNNGPVQRRVRRAFVATGLSTNQIMDWSHPRPGTNRHHARRSVRRVCERYCERVLYSPGKNQDKSACQPVDALGEIELSVSGILLRKCVPDLISTEIKGELTHR